MDWGKLANRFIQRWDFFAICAAVFIFKLLLVGKYLHFPYFGNQRDYDILFNPLAQVHSWGDYLAAWKNKKIFDCAPLRDLLFSLELSAFEKVQVNIFLVVSLGLWFGILSWVWKILDSSLQSGFVTKPLFLFYALHPAFINSLLWIPAQKHLLSAFFMLGFLSVFFRSGSESTYKQRATQLFLYLGSVLSHPIAMLMPLLYLLKRKKRELYREAPLFAAMLFAIAANFYYYKWIYPAVAKGNDAFTSTIRDMVGNSILAFSRYFAQFFLPIIISPIDYFPGAGINFLGLLIGAFFVSYCLRLLRWEALTYLGIFALPLSTTIFRLDRIFANDTYLLVPALGLLLLSGKILESWRGWQKIAPKLLYAGMLGIGALFFFLSQEQANAWQNEASLWQLAMKKEDTPQVRVANAHLYFDKGEYELALDAVQPLVGQSSEATGLYADIIFLSSKILPAEKWKLLSTVDNSLPEVRYIKASLLAAGGLYRESLALLHPMKENFPQLFGRKAGLVAAEYIYFCESAGNICAGERRMVEAGLAADPRAFADYKEREKQLAEQPKKNKSGAASPKY